MIRDCGNHRSNRDGLAARIEPLVVNLRDLFNDIERELTDFLGFLDVQSG